MDHIDRLRGTASRQTTSNGVRHARVRTRAAAGAGAVLLLTGGGAALVASGAGAQAAPADQAGRPNSLRLLITDATGRAYAGDANQAFAPTAYSWSGSRAVDASGRITAAPKYGSFTFTHAVGPGSIDLLTAMSRNVTLRSVTLEVSQNDAAGRTATYFTYKLADAHVVGVEQQSPESQAGADAVRVPPQETVTLTYASVSMQSSVPGRGTTTWTP